MQTVDHCNATNRYLESGGEMESYKRFYTDFYMKRHRTHWKQTNKIQGKMWSAQNIGWASRRELRKKEMI